MSAGDGATPLRVCFVCTGNICRSPMAEVVLRTLGVDSPVLRHRLEVSSAGTGNWHEGEPMDPRARRALEAAGYADHGHVARPIDRATLSQMSLVVGLDRRHQQILRSRTAADPPEIVLLRQFDPAAGGALDVPDPYYGDGEEFGACLAMVEAGCRGLLAELERR